MAVGIGAKQKNQKLPLDGKPFYKEDAAGMSLVEQVHRFGLVVDPTQEDK